MWADSHGICYVHRFSLRCCGASLACDSHAVAYIKLSKPLGMLITLRYRHNMMCYITDLTHHVVYLTANRQSVLLIWRRDFRGWFNCSARLRFNQKNWYKRRFKVTSKRRSWCYGGDKVVAMVRMEGVEWGAAQGRER